MSAPAAPRGHKRTASEAGHGNALGKVTLNGRPLRVGSDFCGINTPLLALSDVNICHSFACDNSETCKKLVMKCSAPNVFIDDATTRDVKTMPTCDILFSTFPCQSFSAAGQRKGVDDPRGLLALFTFEYVKEKRPPAIVFENVDTLATIYKSLADLICKVLEDEGYAVHTNVLVTSNFGVPQKRRRWYLVAIDNRMPAARPFQWPQPSSKTMSLNELILREPADRWATAPPEANTRARANVLAAYESVVHDGKNPFDENCHVVVDCGCSPNFRTFQINRFPTITAGRASTAQGWWSSFKGGFVSIGELCRLQGFQEADIDWVSCKVSRSAFGHCVGNACSVNLLRFLIPHVLLAAGFASRDDVKALVGRAEASLCARHL